MNSVRGFSIILIFALVAPSFSMASWAVEQRKVDFLLRFVENSQVTFVRNGDEYPAQKAAEHLRMKLERAQGSWFAPPKEEWTAVMFIEKIASKSSLSGQPYYVILASGERIRSRTWLLTALSTYQD